MPIYKHLLDNLKINYLHPLKEFIHDSRAIGVVLLICTAASLILTNILPSYTLIWEIEIPFFHSLHLPHSILHFINDGLMSVFFFLAGMEIRRELVKGELSSLKQSLLPVGAAVGGMLIPALIFLSFNYSTPYANGWGVPMATDIAFSIGVASLLGNKVPLSLKIFLTALAIIDDLGTILVIALFYGSKIQWWYLVACALIILLLYFLKRRQRKIDIKFIILGLLLWYCMFNSGIHATVAGVIFAFIIPYRYVNRLEIQLHHPVYFVIMPLFALANTAINLNIDALQAVNSSLGWGIIVGLFLGKPLGVLTMSIVLVKLKLAQLPSHCNWKHIIGAGILAGIGFTMSIFIATLAFYSAIQDIVKISILIASIMSMLAGYIWLKSTNYAIDLKKQPLNLHS